MKIARYLKQEELAELSHMDETYVSDLERGKYMPSLFTILKLSYGLDVRIDKFMAKLNEKLSE